MFDRIELTQEEIDWIIDHPNPETVARLNALLDRLQAEHEARR